MVSISKNDPRLEEAKLFLEKGDFKAAAECCEKVLESGKTNGWAYFYKMMAELQISREKDLADIDFASNLNYQKIQIFGDKELQGIVKQLVAEYKQQQECKNIWLLGSSARIKLLERHLYCEKWLQNRADIIQLLEQSIQCEKELKEITLELLVVLSD